MFENKEQFKEPIRVIHILKPAVAPLLSYLLGFTMNLPALEAGQNPLAELLEKACPSGGAGPRRSALPRAYGLLSSLLLLCRHLTPLCSRTEVFEVAWVPTK